MLKLKNFQNNYFENKLKKIIHLKQIDYVFKFDFSFDYFYFLGNIFQNLRVSSPAPVTIVVPSGFIAK
jgi:hypothetical protein